MFCFPFAGGSASFYHGWRKLLPSFIELHPYELPGRGSRIGTELCETVESVVDDIMERIGPQFHTETYAFFGHSMGGLISLELTRRIYDSKMPAPALVFISGKGAPGFAERKPLVPEMEDEALKEYLISLGGISDDFFSNPELVSFFMPVIINDLRLVEKYQPGTHQLFDTDIITLFGKNEIWTPEERKGWSEFTTGRVQQFTFPGGHFFIRNYFPEITRIIAQMLHHQLMP